MKKFEWYMVQCEVKHPWKEQWLTRAEPFKNLKHVREILKKLRGKDYKKIVRNIRIFKVAPYEEIKL